MPFSCIGCASPLQPSFKACPSCGEPITPFLRQHQDRLIGGNYRLTGFLARGGMGEVYLAEHVHLGAPCVIKVMRVGGDDPTLAERFLREARLARKIRHPNVALLYDFSVLADGTQYMVWEFIEGPNLARLVASEGALAPARAISLAIQALRGLEAIHRAGVVHRDISPDNLLVASSDDGPMTKIIDLGIAKSGIDAGNSQTATGVFIGKLRYASPEQLGSLGDDERIDGRSDLYSLGLVLYEMLAGVPAFRATSAHRYVAMQLHEPLPSLSLGVIDDVIAKATAKDRELRYATARAFADALSELLPALESVEPAPRTAMQPRLTATATAPQTPYAHPTTQPQTAAAARRRRPSALVAALPLLAVVLMFAVGAGTWWLWKQRTRLPATAQPIAAATRSPIRRTVAPSPTIAAVTSPQPPPAATVPTTTTTPLLSEPVTTTTKPRTAIELPQTATVAASEPAPPPAVTVTQPEADPPPPPEPAPAAAAALATVEPSAEYQRPGTYKNWRGRIGLVTVLTPFSLAHYRTIAVPPVDVSEVEKAADVDHVRLMRDLRGLLTENLEGSVGGRAAVVLVDEAPSTAGTLVLRYRLRKYRGSFTPGSAIPTRTGVMTTRPDVSGASVVDGEIVDAATGAVLVRFWQEREGNGSIVEMLYPTIVGYVRNSLRAIGGDVGFLLSSF